jgi:hypothetical protein
VTEQLSGARIRIALEAAAEGEDTCPACLETKRRYDAAYYANYRTETDARPVRRRLKGTAVMTSNYLDRPTIDARATVTATEYGLRIDGHEPIVYSIGAVTRAKAEWAAAETPGARLVQRTVTTTAWDDPAPATDGSAA